MKESTTYQAILAEGEAKGEARGRAEGRLEEARHFLLALGEAHLGPPDAAVQRALEAITEVPRLEELGLRVHAVRSWAELLALPASRRRNSRRKPGR
jgi:predicted transposase YdaD